MTLAINGGDPIRKEPFPGWPRWDQQEIDALIAVVKSGQWGVRNGTEVTRFEEDFGAYQQAKHCVCVNSGTTGLRLALQALGIAAGDEVIVPGYTFIATASAVLELGAWPALADVNPATLNLDASEIDRLVTSRTRAVVPVHFGGRPANMDAILAAAQKHNLKVLEDAAQAWGSEWNNRKVGALGDAGVFSFQSSKNITAGEGGAITTNDDDTGAMCRSISNCGRIANRPWYEHHFLGGNYRMTEFQGAVLRAQFARYESLRLIREQNAGLLNDGLSDIDGLQVLESDERMTANSYHLFICRFKREHFSGISKAGFIKALRAEGIPASPGYTLPLYKQPIFVNRNFGPKASSLPPAADFRGLSLPATENACENEAIWLTQNILLGSGEDMKDVIRALVKIRELAHTLPQDK